MIRSLSNRPNAETPSAFGACAFRDDADDWRRAGVRAGNAKSWVAGVLNLDLSRRRNAVPDLGLHMEMRAAAGAASCVTAARR